MLYLSDELKGTPLKREGKTDAALKYLSTATATKPPTCARRVSPGNSMNE